MNKHALYVSLVFVLGAGVGAAGGYYVARRTMAKSAVTSMCNQATKTGREYVFFSVKGKSITLSEKDVYDIKQLYEDGVLPNAIADKFGMTAVMVSRILNSIAHLS